jgi:putative ABC transport system ATP-binding protein
MALLMGPSGSGKSTLLAILSGLLRPTSGQVLALGQELWSMSDTERERFRLRHCGFIFQGYNLFNALTARQQLEMVVRWGEGASARDARRRTDEMLSLLGLAKRSHLRPMELSGGEKQRVAIGRALIKDPIFCFADEPTSALDWAHGEQVVELLRAAAHDRGATVVVVSHDSRIIPYADHVFHLEDGRLLESEDDSGTRILPNHVPSKGSRGNPRLSLRAYPMAEGLEE